MYPVVFVSMSKFTFGLTTGSHGTLLRTTLAILRLITGGVPRSGMAFDTSPLLVISAIISSNGMTSGSFFYLSVFLPVETPTMPPATTPVVRPGTMLPTGTPAPTPATTPPPAPVTMPLTMLFRIPRLMGAATVRDDGASGGLGFLVFLFFCGLCYGCAAICWSGVLVRSRCSDSPYAVGIVSSNRGLPAPSFYTFFAAGPVGSSSSVSVSTLSSRFSSEGPFSSWGSWVESAVWLVSSLLGFPFGS